MPDYIPGRFADRLAWSANFSAKFTTLATSVGGTAAQATAYAALHTAFANAQADVDDPALKTSNAVLARDAHGTPPSRWRASWPR